MISKKVTVTWRGGIHLRPAGLIAKTVCLSKSNVTILFGDRTANGKSVLSIMGASIRCGSEIEIQCDGPDEEETLATLVELVENDFGMQ